MREKMEELEERGAVSREIRRHSSISRGEEGGPGVDGEGLSLVFRDGERGEEEEVEGGFAGGGGVGGEGGGGHEGGP